MTRVLFPAGAVVGIFLFATASRPVQGSTQPLIQWVPVVKWLGHETDDSFPSSADVKDVDLNIHSSICLHGMVLYY
jgi:hypothetical protein